MNADPGEGTGNSPAGPRPTGGSGAGPRRGSVDLVHTLQRVIEDHTDGPLVREKRAEARSLLLQVV